MDSSEAAYSSQFPQYPTEEIITGYLEVNRVLVYVEGMPSLSLLCSCADTRVRSSGSHDLLSHEHCHYIRDRGARFLSIGLDYMLTYLVKVRVMWKYVFDELLVAVLSENKHALSQVSPICIYLPLLRRSILSSASHGVRHVSSSSALPMNSTSERPCWAL
jgi:hypothetical protein